MQTRTLGTNGGSISSLQQQIHVPMGGSFEFRLRIMWTDFWSGWVKKKNTLSKPLGGPWMNQSHQYCTWHVNPTNYTLLEYRNMKWTEHIRLITKKCTQGNKTFTSCRCLLQDPSCTMFSPEINFPNSHVRDTRMTMYPGGHIH